MQTQYHPHGMTGAFNPNVSLYNKPKIAKKVSNKHPIGLGVSPPGLSTGMFVANQQNGGILVPT